MNYVRAIEGVRGLAVLMVMICHQTVFQPDSSFAQIWAAVLHTGWAGVDLFFVLSGFLITSILLDRKDSQNYYRTFYMRRALRIVPLYYLVLFLFIVAIPHLTSIKGAEPLQESSLWFWGFFSNFLIASKGYWIQPALSPSWSLCIEEQFYLLWPLVVRSLSLRQLRMACAFLITGSWLSRIFMSAAGVNAIAIYILPFSRADSIVTGALLATFYLENKDFVNRWRKQYARLLLPTAVLGLGLSAYPGRDTMWMSAFGFSLVVVAAALVVMTAIAEESTPLKRVLESSVLTTIGKYSYAVYLFHIPVVGFVMTFGFQPGNSLLKQTALSLIAGTMTLAFSFFLYHAYEKHFLNLKRWFEPQASARESLPEIPKKTGTI